MLVSVLVSFALIPDHAERGARARVPDAGIHRGPGPVPGLSAGRGRRVPDWNRAQRAVLHGSGLRHRNRTCGGPDRPVHRNGAVRRARAAVADRMAVRPIRPAQGDRGGSLDRNRRRRSGRGWAESIRSYGAHRLSTTLLGGMSMPLYSLCAAPIPTTISPRDRSSRPAPRSSSSARHRTHDGSPPRGGHSDAPVGGPSGLFWLLAVVHGGIGAIRPVPDGAPRARPAGRAENLSAGQSAHVADRPGSDELGSGATPGIVISRAGASW